MYRNTNEVIKKYNKLLTLNVRFRYEADIHYINSTDWKIIYFNVCYPAKADIRVISINA